MATDFFISYASVNRPWAEWIAVELERAGCSTVAQSFDFRPGTDFVHQMQQAAQTANRTIAVLSPAYFDSQFGEAEWRVAFAKDPSGELRLLIPVRVQPCNPPGLLSTRVYVDLVGVGEAAARRKLLAAIDIDRPRRRTASFPGRPEPRFPGSAPPVSNLPMRNPHFSGRDDALAAVYAGLRSGTAAAVLQAGAVHGLGGVGKTELALEFAHRFGSDYDLIWWIPSEQPTSVVVALAQLASRLGVDVTADQAQMVAGLFEQLRYLDRWLLIYDNAESPEQLEGFLPQGGGGNLLITSRWSAWSARAAPLELGVLSRAESVQLLGRRTGLTNDDQAFDELAGLVGDLPLALDEAAAYLDATKESLARYLDLLRNRARELFELGKTNDGRDRRRLATVWTVSLDRIRSQAPAAESLLSLLAFLDPEVPRDLPPTMRAALPAPLADMVDDPLAYNKVVEILGRYSSLSATPATLRMHRLMQTVVHARLGIQGERLWSGVAVNALHDAFPPEAWEIGNWPLYERLLPHVLTACAHSQRLEVEQEKAGSLLYRTSIYLRARGQYRQARPVATQALAMTEAALGQDHSDVAWRHDQLGRILFELGDLLAAREQYERALSIGDKAGVDSFAGMVWRSGLASVLHRLGLLADAQRQYVDVLAAAEEILGRDDPDVAAAHNNVGSIMQELGDLEGARRQFEQALSIGEKALGSEHRNTCVWRNNLGSVLTDLGDFEGARQQFELVLRIGEQALGPLHPNIAVWRSNLGNVLKEMGDFAAAREQFSRALHLTLVTLGPLHPDIGIRRNNLGMVLRAMDESVAALHEFEHAFRVSEASLGPDHPQTRTILMNLRRIPSLPDETDGP